MSEVRRDPLTGATSVISASRQDRPNLPAGCTFCPGGIEAPGDYQVWWFPNRWPALPDGRAEVHLFSPEHGRSLHELGVTGVRRVVDLWAERTAAMGARDDVAYVLVFENRGAEVGATIQHPHGQLYAFDEVPDAARRELDGRACTLCEDEPGPRTVAVHGSWVGVVPHAPMWPYELLLSPRDHVPDLPSSTDGERQDLALLLADVLARLDQLFDAPMPYMLWVHQRPTDGAAWPSAHVHVHVAPILRAPGTPRFVAAGELGSGTWFVPVVPEAAAATLRGLPGAPA